MAMGQTPVGLLRRDVAIAESQESIRLAHAMWEVSLPRAWVNARPNVGAVLRRESPPDNSDDDSQVDAVFKMLAAQGCFHLNADAVNFTFQGARALFDPFKSRWYALYYAHPFWDRLRQAAASRNELVAWAIHNYHISRAAGPVGARLAASVSDIEWRRFFRTDMLEEYWHCDAYYFVQHPSLSLNVQDVKDYVPLPSSLAFEVHALQMAERNPLAHLLIAYFQESTVMFQLDCHRFYEQVEAAYNLPGFFDGWKKHIALDLEHGHADGLSSLFESAIQVSRSDLERALGNAWLAQFYLQRSLDDIDNERLTDGTVSLRLPTGDSSSALQRTAVRWAPDAASLLAAQTPQQLEDWWARISREIAGDLPTLADRQRLARAIAAASYRCLGQARDHDDIVTLGRLCEALQRLTGEDVESAEPSDYDSPWAAALSSHLAELAASPADFLLQAYGVCVTMEGFTGPSLRDVISVSRDGWLGIEQKDGGPRSRRVRLLQTAELLQRWAQSGDKVFRESFTL